MPQHILNIRMDASLKRDFENICEELGLNMSTAITIFAKTVCREKRIPFELTLNTNLPISQEKKAMNKTTYKINIVPECDTNLISKIDETFDDFEEAFNYLEDGFDKMLEEIRSSDDIISFCRPEFSIEFINTDFSSIHGIYWGSEFTYTHDGITEDMVELLNLEEDDDDGEFFDKLYGFIKGLQKSNII